MWVGGLCYKEYGIAYPYAPLTFALSFTHQWHQQNTAVKDPFECCNETFVEPFCTKL